MAAGALGLLMSGAVMAAGCRSSPPTRAVSSGGGAANVASPVPPSTVSPAPGDDIVVGSPVPLGKAGGSVTVAAVDGDVDAGRLFAPPRGRQYVAAQVKGCAGPTEHGVSFAPGYFSVQLADHTVHDAIAGVKKPALAGGTIPGGRCLDGWVTFTIPKDRAPIAVVYDGSRQVKWSLTPTPTNR